MINWIRNLYKKQKESDQHLDQLVEFQKNTLRQEEEELRKDAIKLVKNCLKTAQEYIDELELTKEDLK